MSLRTGQRPSLRLSSLSSSLTYSPHKFSVCEELHSREKQKEESTGLSNG